MDNDFDDMTYEEYNYYDYPDDTFENEDKAYKAGYELRMNDMKGIEK